MLFGCSIFKELRMPGLQALPVGGRHEWAPVRTGSYSSNQAGHLVIEISRLIIGERDTIRTEWRRKKRCTEFVSVAVGIPFRREPERSG